jgi:integrase
MLNELEAGGLAPRTVQYVHATLRAALKQALKWGLVASNVATLVDGPRVERKETQPLTPENALALLRAVRTDRLEALYSVAMALGLRRGEALGLRWSDVDLERRTINVRVQLQQVKGAGLQLVDVKTSHSRHILDLPDPTVNALQAHSERQTFERRAAKDLWQESGLVFTTAIGTPIEAGNLTRSFQRILKRSGLPHARFHDLRHTAASLLLAQGCELWEVSKTLGHSGVQITGDIYAHLYPQARRASADRMGAWLRAAE